MNGFKTGQEEFWSGSFGDDYSERNRGSGQIAKNIALFSEIFSHTKKIRSVIEFGANIGLNLIAIRQLLPKVDLSAVEINQKAVAELDEWGEAKVYPISVFDFTPDTTYDVALTKGLLIHVNPDHLNKLYDLLYKSSNRYICIVEYYNPTPVTIPYRRYKDKLFKRDFAGDMLDMYNDLKLIDYGFKYHRDNNFPLDDITWFLLEKT